MIQIQEGKCLAKKFFHLLFQARMNVSYAKKVLHIKGPTETSSHYSRGEKVQMPSLPVQDGEKGYVDFPSKSTHQEFL